jgi:hypothetical protein
MRRLALALLLACRTGTPSGGDAGTDPRGLGDAAMTFVFADADPGLVAPVITDAASPEDRLAPFAKAVPRAGKSVGHTSVVFRLDFVTGGAQLRAAYKPESKRGHKRFRGEVAAYRLAQALRIPNVPPATVRAFDRHVLAALSLGSLFDDEVVDRGGRVYGAIMPWIDKLAFAPLESPAEKAKWKKELTAGGELEDEDRPMAAQVSTLIVFDVLTGNWDRWSGGQIGIDAATKTLLFVDNDASFFDPVPPAFNGQMAILRSMDRFPRALIERLRTFDAIALADALGDEEPGSPLMAPRVVAAADARRKDLLATVDQKITALGQAAVLYFP